VLKAIITKWSGIIAILWLALSFSVVLLVMRTFDLGWEFEWATGLTFFGMWGVCLSFAVFGLTRGHRISRLGALLLMAYILAYATLSLSGRYQPGAVGLNGVKWYTWAPYGFYVANHPWKNSKYALLHPEERAGGWSDSMIMGFVPLWIVDIHFVHRMRFHGED
jgi:hypothetical protein